MDGDRRLLKTNNSETECVSVKREYSSLIFQKKYQYELRIWRSKKNLNYF